MNATLTRLAHKAGLNPEQAEKALQSVLEILREKLPASIGDQLEGMLGDEAKEFDFNQIVKGKITELGGEAKERLEHLRDDAKETFSNLKEEASSLFNKLKGDENKADNAGGSNNPTHSNP